MESENFTSPEIKASPEFAKIIEDLKDESVEAGRALELSQKPNKAELKLITTIGESEAAVLHIPDGNRWFVIKGTQDHSLSNTELERAADLFAHHHPPQTHFADMPHFHDTFIATTSGKKEFILHASGITHYEDIKTDPISGEAWQPQKQGEVENKFFAFLATQGKTDSYEEYAKIVRTFFEQMGVNPKTIEWKDLPDEQVFEEFLHESGTMKL